MAQPSHAAGVAAGIAAGALWGLTFIAPYMAPDFGAVAISIARYIAYGGLSLGLLLALRAPLAQLLRRHGLVVFWFSLCSSLLYFLLMTVAVQRIGVALTALIIGCLPITVPLSGAWRDGRQLRRIAPALLLIGAGLVLIQWPAITGLAAWPDPFGLLCAIAALALWNTYALQNARYLARHPEIGASEWASLTGLMTLLGLPLLVVLLPVSGETLPPFDDAWPWLQLAGMALATGIGSAWVSAWLWNIASRALPVALAGQLIVSETIFALLYAFALELRLPQPHEAAAMLLAIGGVLLGLRRLRPVV
jgi:drug/metabolite transporter (DMT)-like permease